MNKCKEGRCAFPLLIKTASQPKCRQSSASTVFFDPSAVCPVNSHYHENAHNHASLPHKTCTANPRSDVFSPALEPDVSLGRFSLKKQSAISLIPRTRTSSTLPPCCHASCNASPKKRIARVISRKYCNRTSQANNHHESESRSSSLLTAPRILRSVSASTSDLAPLTSTLITSVSSLVGSSRVSSWLCTMFAPM